MPTLPVNFEMPYDNFQIVVRIRIIKDVHILEGTFEHIKKNLLNAWTGLRVKSPDFHENLLLRILRVNKFNFFCKTPLKPSKLWFIL